MIIIVTGTPGTGKTTISKKMSKSLNYRCLNVKTILEKYRLKEEYDLKRKCYIISIPKLKKALIREISKSRNTRNPKNLIIDSHLSHYLPKRYVDLCIVTKTDLKQLNSRLKKRRYSQKKIRENLDAEIFDICLNEAKEFKHNIIIINTTKKQNIAKIISKIKNKLNKNQTSKITK